MNREQLMRRDPAMAALMGAMPAGADFGVDFGDDMGAEYAGEYGADYGVDFGAAAPHPAAMARHHVAHHMSPHHPHHPHMRRKHRELLLNPNEGSSLKVERYSFSVILGNIVGGTAPVFGTGISIQGTNTPDVWFRPERATVNVPSVGLVLVQDIKVGNVSGQVGGFMDAFDLSALAVGTSLSLPLMSPSTKANFTGSWTTFVPPGFVTGVSFTLLLSFKGHATMAPRE